MLGEKYVCSPLKRIGLFTPNYNSSLADGSNGSLLWDFSDTLPEAWKGAPYRITSHDPVWPEHLAAQ